MTSSFMSPTDSKAWNNTNRVRMFGKCSTECMEPCMGGRSREIELGDEWERYIQWEKRMFTFFCFYMYSYTHVSIHVL